jgi:hypothetical protein
MKIHFHAVARRNREFINDVLAGLIRRNITFRGCRPYNVTWTPTGSVNCHFVGEAFGRISRNSVTFRALIPPDATDQQIKAAARPEAIVEACAEAVSRIHEHDARRTVIRLI